jgi:hypothetical protein
LVGIKNEKMNGMIQINRIADIMNIKKSMNDGQKYHPPGVPVPHHDLCYNPTIRQKRIENQIRALADDKIMAMDMLYVPKPRRGAMIIATDMTCTPKPRRGNMIISNEMTCVPKPRRGDMIIEHDMMCAPKTRRVDMIIANDMTYAPKIRRVDMIISNAMMCVPKIRQLADEMIIENSMDDGQKYHPLGVPVPHHDLRYNPTIRHLADKKPNPPFADDMIN